MLIKTSITKVNLVRTHAFLFHFSECKFHSFHVPTLIMSCMLLFHEKWSHCIVPGKGHCSQLCWILTLIGGFLSTQARVTFKEFLYFFSAQMCRVFLCPLVHSATWESQAYISLASINMGAVCKPVLFPHIPDSLTSFIQRKILCLWHIC